MMSGVLTWPKFATLDPGPIGFGLRALRSGEWSELATDWIAQNNPLPVRIVGRSPTPAFAAGAFSDVWPGASPTAQIHPLPASEKTLAVASDSVNDVNTSGTGAWQVTVPYLDISYVWHYAVFALNGTTKVNTALSIDGGAGGTVTHCYRVLPFAFISAAGTGITQAGNIYLGDNVDAFTSGIPAAANMFDMLLIGDNRSHSTCFTVPAGMGFMPLHMFTMNTAAGASAFYGKAWYASARWPGVLSGTGIWTPGASISPWQRYILSDPASTAGLLEWYPNWPDFEPPQTEIKLQCASSAASGETSAVIEGVLFPWPMNGNP
jgi:hypothetical protein